MKPGHDYIGVSVAFFCHDGQGNFVLHKRSQNCRDEQGRWDTGGGKMEFGETPEETLSRELLEEYGCTGIIEEVLPPNSCLREQNGVKTHWLILPYVVKVNRSEVKMNEPESMDEIGWFTLSNLPKPLHSGGAHDIELNFDKLKKYST